jgi:Tol biopolymer transport system component/DNA-binding winged helix-turn-helix (wHTH) protein
LDAAAGELRKSGVLIKLQPQPFRILQLLVERSGTVVTREEIQHSVWNGDIFVDFEHGINFSINQIRAALADNAEKPRYVETLPRRGYRFIASVEVDEIPRRQPAAPPAKPQDHQSESGKGQLRRASDQPHKKPFLRKFSLIAAGLLVFLASALVYYLGFSGTARVSRATQLTFSGRLDPWGRITSDGSRLFYLERDGDHWNSMEVATTGGESQAFPKPSQFPNLKIFGISPDGSQLLVAPFASRTGNLPVWLMPLVGGAPGRIGDLTANDATFSPDGKRIALAKTDGVFLADLNGSNLRRIASAPGRNEFIAWSPDGKLLRFTQYNSTTGASSLWEVTPQGRNLRLVLPPSTELAVECCGRWTSDGAYYLFTSGRTGHGELWALKEPLAGISWLRHKPIRLTSSPIFYGEALPANRGHIVYAHGGSMEEFELASVDAKTSQAKPLLSGTKATDVGYSPDRQWIYYLTGEALWRSRPDGRERLQLATNSPIDSIYPPRWSQDSKSILFLEQNRGGDQIYIVPAEGGPLRAISGPGQHRGWPDWSPDGQKVVFSVEEEPQKGQAREGGVFVHDLRTAQSTRVPGSAGFYAVRWSPDGQYLAAVSEDSKALKLYDIRQKRWTEIARGNFISTPQWATDSMYVYFQDILESGEPVYRFRPKVGSLERVHSFEDLLKSGALRCGFIGFGPDGSLLVQLARGGGNLYKIELDLP